MNAYEIKRERRINRLERLAKLYEEQSNTLYSGARSMAEVIPFGQPILVGHHSEGRDRAYRARIQRRFEKAGELQDKSAYYARRAESATKNRSISSDDPEAVFKLGEKIEKLEKLQDTFKRVNKIIRGFNLATHKAECIAEIVKTGLLTETHARKIVEPDFCGRVGFAAYELTNNNANIARLRKRAEELTKRQAQETKTMEYGEIKVIENVEENRLQIFFPGKPSDEKRASLKSWGFRWSPTNGCWQAYLNNNAKHAVKQLIERN